MKMIQDANNLTSQELQIRNAYICASNGDGWNKSKPGLGGQKMKSLFVQRKDFRRMQVKNFSFANLDGLESKIDLEIQELGKIKSFEWIISLRQKVKRKKEGSRALYLLFRVMQKKMNPKRLLI